MLRVAARRASALRPRTKGTAASPQVLQLRPICASAGKGLPAAAQRAVPSASADDATPEPRAGLMARIFGDRGGQNPILSALGYYSRESVGLGAGRAVYDQLRVRAQSAMDVVSQDKDREKPFALRFQMLSVHVYLTLRRLRVEKGSSFEADCTTIMQCIFDLFWTDVRNRMLIGEEGMTLIPSGRWVRECEQMFFGMATAFDEAWDDKDAFRAAIDRNVTSVKDKDVDAFFRYMWTEKERLDALSMEKFLQEQEIWSPNFKFPETGRRRK